MLCHPFKGETPTLEILLEQVLNKDLGEIQAIRDDHSDFLQMVAQLLVAKIEQVLRRTVLAL